MTMQTPHPDSDFTRLRRFRQQVYPLLGPRRDMLFELMDAVIQTPQARSFAELSLAPACRRKWPSLYKALNLPETSLPDQAAKEVNEGTRAPTSKELVQVLCIEQVPTDKVAQIAIDVTGLRRMRSPTLKERRYCHGAAREVGGRGVTVGLPYSIAAWIPERGRSFAPTLHVHRLRPEETAVEAAVAQLCYLGYELPSGLDWRAALDGAYGNQKFFAPLQHKALRVVARTRDDRVFHRPADPAKYSGHGRHSVFGEKFRFRDEMTWGPPDEVLSRTDPWHGEVELQLWRNLSQRGTGKFVGVDVIRSRIHLEAKEPPKPRWYLAHNGRPEDRLGLADWSETIAHRWGIEPANRFRKERLYAELPKVQTAGRSDHWQLLIQVIEWMLYFARLAVRQKVLPWQKPQSPEKITPNRVIGSLAGHLSEVGTPAKPPLPRGNAPGWPTGRPRTRPERYKLVPKTPKKTTRVSKNE